MSDIQAATAQNLVFVRDIKLAAALSAMGVPPRLPVPVEKISKNGQQPTCLFWFLKTDELADYVRAWEAPADYFAGKDGNDRNHFLCNAEHPFWYVRAALRNRERLLDVVKTSKVLLVMEKNGRIYLTTKDDPNAY